MKCENCNRNEATINIVKIIEGNNVKKIICSECANKNSDDEMNLLFANEAKNKFNENIISILISNLNLGYSLNQELKCNNCETTYLSFNSNGSLGCNECYSTFKNIVLEVMKKIFGDFNYVGKIPKKENELIINNKKIIKLKETLKETIIKEEYEEAAKIRDEIKILENKNLNRS